jgi:fucose permease
MLLLYGGVEASMNGWLTTYILRYGDHTLSSSQLSTSLFWIALIAGRLAAAGALTWLGERTMLRLALATTGACIAALARADGTVALTTCAILLGIAISPAFPVCFSIFMAYRPRAQQAGLALAMTGIGAALIPWLTGMLSTHSGSLHTALIIPLVAAVAMLLMSFTLPRAQSSFPDASGV